MRETTGFVKRRRVCLFGDGQLLVDISKNAINVKVPEWFEILDNRLIIGIVLEEIFQCKDCMFSQICSRYISRFLSQAIIIQLRTGVPFINNTVIQDDLDSPAHSYSILYNTIPVTKGAEDANYVTLHVRKTSRILGSLCCRNRRSSASQRGRDGLPKHNTRKEEIEESKKLWSNCYIFCKVSLFLTYRRSFRLLHLLR